MKKLLMLLILLGLAACGANPKVDGPGSGTPIFIDHFFLDGNNLGKSNQASENSLLMVTTEGGYSIAFEVQDNGDLHLATYSSIHLSLSYETSDCTGQAYMASQNNIGYRKLEQKLYYSVLKPSTITVKSYKLSDNKECKTANTTYNHMYTAYENNERETGVSSSDFTQYVKKDGILAIPKEKWEVRAI